MYFGKIIFGRLLILFMVFPSLLFGTSDKKMTVVSLDEMVKMAGQEGKLILIDFYADWCTPCKWMDETVFNHPDVKNEMEKSYILKKVNIDDISGFEMKKHFKVSVLPTILILNSEGKVVERVEKTITTLEFLELLRLHNVHRNKLKMKHQVNTSPTKSKEAMTEKNLRDTYLKYIESNRRTNRKYRLQLGVYQNYKDAFAKVNTLNKTFIEPIIVINDYRENNIRYKVMMGEFETIEEAEGFRKILNRDFDLESIIQ